MSSLRCHVAVAALLTLGSPAFATTPDIPPLSPRTAAGVWEGFCQSADEIDAVVFGVRLRVARDAQGTLTIGRWFGGDQPFMGQVLALSKLDVGAGKVHITATSEVADGWRQITMSGTGRAFPESGWLKVRVEIGEAAYRCDAQLVKSARGLFSEVSALVRSLNSLEKSHAKASSSK
jgi:hypothetical protein